MLINGVTRLSVVFKGAELLAGLVSILFLVAHSGDVDVACGAYILV